MEKPKRNRILKALKITVITFCTLLLMMFLFPIVFPGKIAQEVKTFANQKLDGELNFSEAQLSFFNHFPSLTLTLKDFKLNGSAPYKNETLISANEIAFGINVKSLIFDSQVKIDKIFLSNALMNVRVNEKGEANYNVYVSEDEKPSESNSNTSLKLEKIDIRNSHLVYNDQSTKILIDAKGFNYVGKGDLDQSVFDIYTEAEIDSLNFTYDQKAYLLNKKIKADLITKINTTSLAFVFQQNNLKINKLPVQFTGKFDFLKNGYDMDFKIDSHDSRLNDFFTALPPEYVTWLEKTKVKGSTSLALSLKGQYIASQQKSPDLQFNMKIRDGQIEYKNAPFPVSNIFLNFDTKLPGLNPDRVEVKLDSLFFNVGKDYLKAIVNSKGLQKPQVNANVQASLDLKKLDQAFGFENMTLQGLLKMNVKANGTYDKAKSIFPVTKGTVSMKGVTIQTQYYPHPIQNINLLASISNGNGTFKESKLVINPASFVFEGNPFYLKASFQDFDDVAYDVKAKGTVDVAKVYKVFALQGLNVTGYVKADVAFQGKQSDAMKGNYAKLHNSGTLELKKIKTTSEYLPKPFMIDEGLFTFNQDKMNFSNFLASYGKSDFKMSGYLQNVINFVLSEKAVLKGKFNLVSDYINVDEFMSNVAASPTSSTAPTSGTASKTTETGVVIIPPNFDLQFIANAAKVDFNELNLKNAKGDLSIAQGKMTLKNTGFNIIDCPVNMDIVYGSETPTKAFFDFKVKAENFDIKRAYNEIKMFHDMASAAESAQGKVSLDYKVGGKLDGNMQPIYPSLVGGGTLSVKEVKMKGFRMFGAVSDKTHTNAIRNPDVTKVDIKTTIKNNIITIERFKFKFAGFRPRIEGTTSFDGQLNIKMRLGLPPLGIIGIPLTVTGTKDAPKVKLGKKGEDIEEKEYTDTPALTTPAATPESAPAKP
ncbi:AsmA-like C-terminal region-containing protein [Flavobacterium sp.]|uniref:AsmA-like C-terminal region-containing protein n=1 Tax=Flavobacterium sp. TaxID=239 RepID=UPI00261FEB30|nr:AsmA-like C-terminal region-containing protein [Flavobacterium sp.]